MGAGAHRDAGPVYDRGDVVRMCALHFKRHDRPLARRVADDTQRIDLPQALVGVFGNAALVRAYPLLADRIDIIDRSTETYRLHDRRCPCLESVRRLAISDAILEYFADHLTAAIERLHRRQICMLAVKHADTGRSVNLVAGESIKIAVDIAHVDVEMHRALRTIDQHRNAVRMREFDDFFYRHRGAKNVRHLRDGDHFGSRCEQLLEFVEQKIAFVVDRRPLDHGTLALAQEMPWHDVGVVLHDRKNDFVARLDALTTERVGHKIDRLGGVAGKDDLFGALGIDKTANF